MNRSERRGRPTEDTRRAIAARRASYQEDLARGVSRFFEPRRESCPWCGSGRLRQRLRTTDLLQHKPGDFVLDECRDCRHVFQNPRLNGEGLEFYYRDFYDGLGEQHLGSLFAGRDRTYRGRAEALLPFTRHPKRWLDVGTGHGHFCEAAARLLPGTSFDGLDSSAGVELARQAGRVEHGFRGGFVEFAREPAEPYDVVSMFHYLEHSTDPRAELASAHRLIRPGGHLVIEVPDPGSRCARLLGRWWLPWLQPQHLHLIRVENLRDHLTALGFTVLAEQHCEPHEPLDLLAAVWLFLDGLAPREDAPWLPARPTVVRRALRTAVLLAGVPALLLATLLDHLAKPLAPHLRLTNAYRLVARRT
ncbi:class I SAM-dependent methyltransferase [Wenjunlia tyrosinilytica]|uniref:Methyltransferase type 12 n=1 Tax=Wenjunlia tyrosinilytica TaxID=1544741 RepID=A0A917ZG04_9ACTN|nr:class I SAM-dependent methyltransferase [Wenjunlia tyrosinilytica]GGO82073.1 methyltransferase type 12 [Wenjunlia tyrosinilytica]